MPNWTTNYVTFEGSKEKMKHLKSVFASKKSVFDFNKILPMPKHSDTFFAEGSLGEEEREKFGHNNWYDWSVLNWGTKWNAVDASLNEEDEKLEYYFQTAWDAPRGVVKELWDGYVLCGCTNINWECSHEFEDEIEVVIGRKNEKANS
jgi:hypothetical protein